MAARVRLVRPASAGARRAAVDDGDEARGAAPPRRAARARAATAIGRVITREQHPNADRLSLCSVDIGTGEPQQIVCGARNFEAGATVAVALPGAVLPDGTELRVAKLRGLESHGMMLSERELELGQDHDGIMLLPGDWQIGDALIDHLAIADDVLEFEITSNRPDCQNVYGIAREVSAVVDTDLRRLARDGAGGGRGRHGRRLREGPHRRARHVPALGRARVHERARGAVAAVAQGADQPRPACGRSRTSSTSPTT